MQITFSVTFPDITPKGEIVMHDWINPEISRIKAAIASKNSKEQARDRNEALKNSGGGQFWARTKEVTLKMFEEINNGLGSQVFISRGENNNEINVIASKFSNQHYITANYRPDPSFMALTWTVPAGDGREKSMKIVVVDSELRWNYNKKDLTEDEAAGELVKSLTKLII